MTAVNRVLLQQLETGTMCQKSTDVQNDVSAKSQDMSMSSDAAEESEKLSDDLSAQVSVLYGKLDRKYSQPFVFLST